MIDSSYSPTLVATSVVIASLASYTALDLAGRVTAAHGRGRLAWLASGSAAMGLGIWSMHFVGMLAFQMPIEIAYDVPLVGLSALIAIAASGLAMFVVSRTDLPVERLVVAGLIMGIAIAGMHYTGMAAMRMPAALSYEPLRFWLSIGIAITASMAALWIAFRLRLDDTLLGRWRRAGSAVVMGLAIAGMHYTAMSAARFAPRSVPAAIFAQTIPAGAPLATAVIGGTLIVLMLALVGATVDRRTVAHARSIHEREMALAHERIARAEAETARHVAETANASKSQFLAVMSHELRTPLNAIGGYADLIQLGVYGPLTSEQLDGLARMKQSAKHLLAMISEILDYTQVDAGRAKLLNATVSVGMTLNRAEALVAPQFREKGLAFSVEPCDALLAVHADPEKLTQVIVNLLTNALKFTPRGGRVSLSCVAGDQTVGVRVEDTGPGIAAEHLERIFEPFYQADRSLTRSQGGIGLGLAISRDLVRAMGGDIAVKSTPGRGATFTVTLLRADHTTPRPPPPRQPTTDGRMRKAVTA
jgi:signal transduction histidine kinase